MLKVLDFSFGMLLTKLPHALILYFKDFPGIVSSNSRTKHCIVGDTLRLLHFSKQEVCKTDATAGEMHADFDRCILIRFYTNSSTFYVYFKKPFKDGILFPKVQSFKDLWKP